MKGLRLAVITRRYWPLTGGTEQHLAHLVDCLKTRGICPRVVTAGFDAGWPKDLQCREIPVHRVSYSHRFGWSTRRYLASLAGWLRAHQRSIDLVCVSRLGPDAAAVVRVFRETGIPVVLRTEDDGVADIRALGHSGRRSCSTLHDCLEAAAIVTHDPHVERQLMDFGCDPSRIYRIPNGVPAFPERTSVRFTSSRSALFNINHDLLVPAGAKLAVHVGSLQDSGHLSNLLRAWCRVTAKCPHARLWLVGDGPLREPLLERIRQANLLERVILPGSFDDLEEVFWAADIYIHADDRPGLPIFLLQAMAAGLPVVVCGTSGQRETVLDRQTACLVPGNDPVALAAAVGELFRDPARSCRLGRTAAALVQRSHLMDHTAAEHVKLFQQLAANRWELPG